ncbi:uncharacterized protein PV06_06279 [Exophiala oligosperma]|uniref:Uncharacterized protein n=1 Tax=Exophiala oligosperma TaxID=215243 RepID=A0A0D2DJZ8_9EURO|nr:uncharacterized protein PV06_06279 [Exophiala oligosperma]KIW42765.1 hypothetical protein PV06_06279 [Exophiala oligosperma]
MDRLEKHPCLSPHSPNNQTTSSQIFPNINQLRGIYHHSVGSHENVSGLQGLFRQLRQAGRTGSISLGIIDKGRRTIFLRQVVNPHNKGLEQPMFRRINFGACILIMQNRLT